MADRNNAGRLGAGFISVCLETRWLGHFGVFYVPEPPCTHTTQLTAPSISARSFERVSYKFPATSAHAPESVWISKMTQEEKRGSTLNKQKSRHIYKHSNVHPYQPRRTAAKWPATALGSKKSGHTRKQDNHLLPSTGSSQGGAIEQLMQINKWTKPINSCVVIYMFFKTSSVFIWCHGIKLYNICMSHKHYIPGLCPSNI